MEQRKEYVNNVAGQPSTRSRARRGRSHRGEMLVMQVARRLGWMKTWDAPAHEAVGGSGAVAGMADVRIGE